MDPAIIVAGASLLGTVVALVFSWITARNLTKVEHEYAQRAHLQAETGPLRLYMYLSARSSVRWLQTYAKNWEGHHWPVRVIPSKSWPREYRTAGPLVYRLLRPLTVAGLIVHRTRQSDLAFDDEQVVEIVRFHNAAYDMLTREEILNVPQLDLKFDPDHAWDEDHRKPRDVPFDRIRDTSLRSAADALTIPQKGTSEHRCMSHAEFLARWQNPSKNVSFHRALEPVTSVIDQFDPKTNPVFWLRLLGYSYTCMWYLRAMTNHADKHGFDLEPPDYDLGALLQLANTPALSAFLQSRNAVEELTGHFERIIWKAL